MKKFLFSLPLLLWSMAVAAQQQLIVEPLNADEQAFAIAQIGKLTMDSQTLYLYATDGTLLGQTDYADLRLIRFANRTDPTELNDNTVGLRVYPNPATENIVISGLQNEQTVRVYDLNGNMLLSQSAQAQTVVPVGNLPVGNYLLQVGAQVVKFIKQ